MGNDSVQQLFTEQRLTCVSFYSPVFKELLDNPYPKCIVYVYSRMD